MLRQIYRYASALLAVVIISLSVTLTAPAAGLTWNTNTTGSPTDGGGTWGTGSNWWNGSVDSTWSSGGTATFGAGNGTAGAVAVSGSQTANALSFNAAGSGGYLLNGGTVGLVGTAPAIAVNASSGTIASTLTSTSGLTLGGTGALTLGGPLSYTGTTSINSGALVFNNSSGTIGSINIGGASGASSVYFHSGTMTTFSTASQGANFYMANAASSTASYFQDGGSLSITGSNVLDVGQISSSSAMSYFNLGGGTFAVANLTGPSTFGVSSAVSYSQSGGLFTFTPLNTSTYTTRMLQTANLATAPTTMNISGGSFQVASNAILALGVRASTTMTISGNAMVSAGVLSFTRSDITAATAAGSVNLNGGTLQVGSLVIGATSTVAGGIVNFNGGTFQAAPGSLANWVPANSLLTLNVANSGAIIDTNSQSVAIAAPLIRAGGISTGGLTKLGGGMLTLSASSNYAGPTTLSAGTLDFSGPGSIKFSALSLSDATTLDLTQLATGNTFSPTGLTFAGSATVNISDVAARYSNTPAINVPTLTTASSPINLNVTNIPPGTTGAVQILQYSSSNGAGVFNLASPVNSLRNTYSLTDIGGLIELSYTGAYCYWAGLGNLSWDTASANNWYLSTAGTATTFVPGDVVVFDDNVLGLSGTSVVTISASNVSPYSVTFANNQASYTLQGTRGIVGAATLSVTGGGNVTIANSNGYSGGTTLGAGLLNVSNSAALGAGAFTLAGGSLDNTSSSAMTLAGNIAQTWSGGFTFVGSNPLNLGSGAVTLLNSPTVNVSGSTLTAAGNLTGTAGGLNVAGTGTLALTGALNYPGATNIGSGLLYINGSSGTIGQINVGSVSSNTGSLYIHGANLTANAGLNTANAGGSMGSYLQDGGTLTVGGANAMNLSNNGSSSFTLAGGALNIATTATFWATIGNNGPMSFTQTGGLFNYSPFVTGSGYDLFVGYGSGGATTMNLSGGTFQTASNTVLALGVQSAATMNISGNALVKAGTVNFNFAGVGSGAAAGTINLNGGTLQAAQIAENYNASDIGGTLNLNGGTLQAAAGSLSPWIPADNHFALNVGSSGAFINTNGQNVSIAQALLQSGGTSTGGLTKLGAGMLTLSGTSSYVGTTTISAGTLTVNGSLTASNVSVNNGATLSGSGSISGGTVNVVSGGIIDLTQNTNASTFSMAGLSFAGGATINLNDVAAQYSSVPAISVNALSTSSSPINLNISNIPYGTAGTMQIMQYSSISGTGTGAFNLASPVGGVGRASYSLVSTGSALDLVYSVPYIYWSGTGSNSWNTTSTTDWILSSTGGSTTFMPGDNTIFDDRASTMSGNAAQVVTISASNVAPTSVTFSNTAASYTLQGTSGISGAAALIVNGAGLVTISNSNNYTGPTTISSGTLQVGTGVAGQDGSIASSNITNNATLVLRDAGPTTFGGTIGGSGSVYLAGPGAVTLTGSNPISKLVITSSGSITGGTISLPAGNTLVSNNAAGMSTISSFIAAGANGAGETWASGVGTLNIAGGAKISLFSGSFNLAGGNFALGGGAVSINDSTAANYVFNLNNAAGTTTDFLQSGGSLTAASAAGAGNIMVFSTAGNANYTMTGGTINLNSPSAVVEAMYVGYAAATNNVLTINGPNAVVMPEILNLSAVLSATSAVNLINGTLATDGLQNGVAAPYSYFNFSGGTLEPMGRAGTQWGSATAANNCTITVSNSNAFISTTAITGVTQSVMCYCTLAGTGALTIGGNGTLTLSGSAAAYSGPINLISGTATLGRSNALGTGDVSVNGGILNIAAINTTTVNSVTLAAGKITGTSGVLNAGSFNLQSGTAAAVLGGANAPLVKTTAGQAFLTAANTYGGPTTINNGTLSLGATGTLGNSAAVTVSPGAVFDVSAYGSAGYNLFGYNGGILTAGRTAAFAADINGTLNLSYGTVSVVGPSAVGTLTIAGSLNLIGPETYAYVPGDQIVMSGAFGQNFNMVTLALGSSIAPATYTPLSFNGGSPDASYFSMGGAYQSPTRQSFAFNAGGSALTMTVTGAAGNLVWNSTNSVWDAASTPSWHNTVTSAADVFYNGDPVTFNDMPGGSGGTVNINGMVYPLTLSVSNTAVNYTFTGYGSIAGPAALVKNGPGALVINTDNSYAGGTVLNAGLIVVQNTGALGSGPLTIGGGTLEIASGYQDARSIALTSPAATVSVDGSQTYSNSVAISGSGALNKAGAGMLVLAASNTYGGGTTVSDGTLQLGGAASLGSGGLVANGGTLDLASYSVTIPSFSGHSGRITDFGSNGGTTTLAVAQSSVTTFGGTIANGPTNVLALSVTGPGTLYLSGTNTYSGGTTVNGGSLVVTNNAALADGSSLTVGNASLFSAPVVPSPVASAAAVPISPVPEPNTLGLLAAAAFAAGWRIRRQRNGR
jgi:autotransporter-associated beta strand protein